MTELQCSFCGKPRDEVKRFIGGPGNIFICNECVGECADVLGDMPPGGRRIELDEMTMKAFLEEFGRPPDSITVGEVLDVYDAQALVVRTRVRKSPKNPEPETPVVATLPTIAKSELDAFLSRKYGVPAINLDSCDEMIAGVADVLPREICTKHKLVPVNRVGTSLVIAMADPSNIHAIDDVKFLTGYNVEVVVATEEEIMRAIEKHVSEKFEKEI